MCIRDRKITFANAFGIADDVLKQAVSSISELVGYSDNVLINQDFADVSAIMRDAGRAHLGVGVAAGKEKAEAAAMAAVSSPLLETSINGAMGVLINVTGAPDMELEDVETAANIVMEAANPEANIIFGATFDKSLEDALRVTVIATGFDDAGNSGVFTTAGEKAKAEPETPDAPNVSDIDDIFRIFNRR